MRGWVQRGFYWHSFCSQAVVYICGEGKHWKNREAKLEKSNEQSGFGSGQPGRAEQINLLASASDWAWPQAVRQIFEPRGVNLLMAGGIDEFVVVLENRRIHAAIVDLDSQSGGLAAIKVIRIGFPTLPCLILKSRPDENLLGKALELEVFSVLEKPVDLQMLQRQLDRLFVKRYNSGIFAE
jgi:response regulator RpfG family c-di-GMP phosphodiesterase